MKFKNILTFSILLALSFSIIHEFAFAAFDENQCSVSEFINELDAPTGSDDICDTHHEYHHAIMITINEPNIDSIYIHDNITKYKKDYFFLNSVDLFRPPRT